MEPKTFQTRKLKRYKNQEVSSIMEKFPRLLSILGIVVPLSTLFIILAINSSIKYEETTTVECKIIGINKNEITIALPNNPLIERIDSMTTVRFSLLYEEKGEDVVANLTMISRTYSNENLPIIHFKLSNLCNVNLENNQSATLCFINKLTFFDKVYNTFYHY